MMRLRSKLIIIVIVTLICVLILFLLSCNAFLPKIAFVPTYEYIALKEPTDTVALSLYAFVNRFGLDPEKLMIDVPGVDIENTSIELSESFINYGLYSILIDGHVVSPKVLKTTTVNAGFDTADMDSYFVGELAVDFPIKTDDSMYLDATCGTETLIVTDPDTITQLKNSREDIEPAEDGSYILRQTIGRGMSLSNTKLPYAVTPFHKSTYLNKVQYGFGKYYSFGKSNESEYVGEIPIDLNGKLLAFITPVITYQYEDHIGQEIAPKVILLDGSKSTKDLFFASIQSAN